MSLEESLGKLSQTVSQQEKAKEEKALSGVRKNITHLGKEEKGLEDASFALEKNYGLAGEQLANFREAKRIINNLFENHKDDLEKAKGIKNKWELANAPEFKKEPEIKAFKGSSKDLRETMRKVIEAKENLEGKGIGKTARKFFSEEVRKEVGELDEEINGLKLQTPEGQEERKQKFKSEFKSKLEEKAGWNSAFHEKIGEANLVTENALREAKNFGENGENIIKETITEVFQEKNEKIKSLKEINQEFNRLENFNRIINGSPNLSSKIETIKDLTDKDLPEALFQDLKRNPKFSDDCLDYFRTRNTPDILKHTFFADYLLRDVDNWLSNARGLCRNGKSLIESGYSRWDYGMPNAVILNEDAEKILGLLGDLKKNLAEELSLYIKNEGKTDISIKLKEFYGKKEADYNFKPKEEIKDLIRQKGFNEAKDETEKKIKRVEAKLSAKIDLDWLKAEKSLFKEENQVEQILQKDSNLQKREKRAKEAHDDLRAVRDDINIIRRQDEFIKIDKREENGKMVEFFYSPQARIDKNEIESGIKAINDAMNNISNQIEKTEKEKPKIFKKGWQAKLDEQIKEKDRLNKKLETLKGKQKEQKEKESQLNGLNKIIMDLNLGREFANGILTIREIIDTLYDKLRAIRIEELPTEEQTIYQNWQLLEKKAKEAEDKYLKAKQELPNF